jgi:hypothetical protein
MIPCAIIGDSIALGTATEFRGCYVSAKVGIPSAAVIGRAPAADTQWTAISAGSNDPQNPRLAVNLRAVRARVHSGRVVWILPQNARAAAIVRAVAAEHGDGVVSFTSGRDHVHPRSYAALAASVRAAI